MGENSVTHTGSGGDVIDCTKTMDVSGGQYLAHFMGLKRERVQRAIGEESRYNPLKLTTLFIH